MFYINWCIFVLFLLYFAKLDHKFTFKSYLIGWIDRIIWLLEASKKEVLHEAKKASIFLFLVSTIHLIAYQLINNLS